MLELAFTPTFNSLEVSARLCEGAAAAGSPDAGWSCAGAGPNEEIRRSAPLCPLSNWVLRNARRQAFVGPRPVAAAAELPALYVRLLSLPVGARDASAARGGGAGSSDSDSDGSGPAAPGEEELVLSGSIVARGSFNMLEAGCHFAAVVMLGPPREAAVPSTSPQVGDVLRLGPQLGRLAAEAQPRRSLLPLVRPAPAALVEAAGDGRVVRKEVRLGTPDVELAGLGGRDCLLVFNFSTLPNCFGLRGRVLRSLLMPWQQLGPWLLATPGNYAYAVSLDQAFVVRLLEHGLFVLPSGEDIFGCPFPVTPFVFKLQEGDGASWRQSKMLRRYRGSFELSCNADLAAQLRRCAAYHEARDGTWITERFIELILKIHRDPSNRIKVYAFELWDKATGELAAASFGLAIGTFFHDFSMCCLIKDRRSAGAVLTKAIGALLRDCGVEDWYWGCKMDYMADYQAHGAAEIPRAEYYARLRGDLDRPLRADPEDEIRAGRALVQTRAVER